MNLKYKIYQANDGKIFQGGEGTRAECERYEIGLSLRGVREKLDKIGYSETDISGELNDIFPRRHAGRHITAQPNNREEYMDFLNYVSLMNGQPSEIREAQKMIPVFPIDMHILVHKGSKRPHAMIVQKEIAAAMCQENEIDLIALDERKPRKETAREKIYEHNGERHNMRTWASIKGIHPATFWQRVKKYGFDRAIEMPAPHTDAYGLPV